jgi:hypothetical protein
MLFYLEDYMSVLKNKIFHLLVVALMLLVTTVVMANGTSWGTEEKLFREYLMQICPVLYVVLIGFNFYWFKGKALFTVLCATALGFLPLLPLGMLGPAAVVIIPLMVSFWAFPLLLFISGVGLFNNGHRLLPASLMLSGIIVLSLSAHNLDTSKQKTKDDRHFWHNVFRYDISDLDEETYVSYLTPERKDEIDWNLLIDCDKKLSNNTKQVLFDIGIDVVKRCDILPPNLMQHYVNSGAIVTSVSEKSGYNIFSEIVTQDLGRDFPFKVKIDTALIDKEISNAITQYEKDKSKRPASGLLTVAAMRSTNQDHLRWIYNIAKQYRPDRNYYFWEAFGFNEHTPEDLIHDAVFKHTDDSSDREDDRFLSSCFRNNAKVPLSVIELFLNSDQTTRRDDGREDTENNDEITKSFFRNQREHLKVAAMSNHSLPKDLIFSTMTKAGYGRGSEDLIFAGLINLIKRNQTDGRIMEFVQQIYTEERYGGGYDKKRIEFSEVHPDILYELITKENNRDALVAYIYRISATGVFHPREKKRNLVASLDDKTKLFLLQRSREYLERSTGWMDPYLSLLKHDENSEVSFLAKELYQQSIEDLDLLRNKK